MNLPLVVAAALVLATAAAHSVLGERYIIRRLLRRSDLPKLFGDDRFTRQTIRYAWHATTVAWCGLAAILLAIGGAFGTALVSRGVLLAVAATSVVSALLAAVLTGGRHLSWVVFVAITALCLAAIVS